MMNNREHGTEPMNETKERISYQHGDYTSRNEYSNDQNNPYDDLDALLYYPRSNDTVQRTIPASRTRGYDEVQDDTLPSSETMKFGSERGRIKEEIHIQNNWNDLDPAPYTGDDKQYKITVKAKVLIAVYAIVVVTIFALIVLNTRLLNNMNEDVAMMENSIQNLQTQKQALEKELSHVSSDNEIIRKALQKGFKQVVEQEVQDK